MTSFRLNTAAALPAALLCYWALLIYNLGAQWSLYDQYHYGWAVPPLSLYLCWKRILISKGGQQNASVPSCPHHDLIIRFMLVLLLFVYAPTRWLHEANPVWRLTSWLWTCEVAAITLLNLSLNGLEARRFLFPMGFLLVAVPWPWPIEQFFVQIFTRFNATSAVELLDFLDVPVTQRGNAIEITAGAIGIDEACSGIRSLQVTLAISLFAGEWYRLKSVRRILVLFTGFLAAAGFNLGRTLLLVAIASWQGMKAMSHWHDPAGVAILLLCFSSLWLMAMFLAPSNLNRPRLHYSANALRQLMQRFQSRAPASPLVCAVSFSLLGWFLLVETGTQLWFRSHAAPPAQRTNWTVQLPAGRVSFETKTIADSIRSEFRFDHGIRAEWLDVSGARWQLFYFRWLPDASLARRVSVQRAKMHGPETCLPHAGLELKADLGTVHFDCNGVPLALRQYAFGTDQAAFYVFFGIYEDRTGSSVLANRRLGTSQRIQAALEGSRNCGQRFLELAVRGYNHPEAAREALQRELEILLVVPRETQTAKTHAERIPPAVD